jgi:steroid delta-isomerase-like uncharacterized protein
VSSDNIALTRRILDEVWNRRNLAVIDELLSADFVFNDPMAPAGARGIETYKQFVDNNLRAFPDLRLTIEDIVSSGDLVASRWHATGTHTGPLAGYAPTGKSMTITGMNFARIVDGKFVESWGNWNALGMLQQLELLSGDAEVKAA